MTVPNPDNDSYAAIQEQASAWWTRLRSNRLTRVDADAFRQWCAQSEDHARAWREVMHLWEALDPVLTEAAQHDPLIAHAESAKREITHRPGRRAFFGGALAATAAVALALRPPLQLWPSVLDFTADYRTGTGEQRQVAISDHVTVQMNTQTRINLRSGTKSAGSIEATQSGGGIEATESAGGIELVSGEVEVAANLDAHQIFTVFAGSGKMSARSARVNVRHTGPQVCVTCLAGAVDVEHIGERRTLAPGQQLSYDARGLDVATAVDPVDVTAWRTGSLSFAGSPLSDVVEEINRYRPGRVILRNPELAARRVRMRFSIHQTDLALAMIRDLYGARMTELPGGVVLLA